VVGWLEKGERKMKIKRYRELCCSNEDLTRLMKLLREELLSDNDLYYEIPYSPDAVNQKIFMFREPELHALWHLFSKANNNDFLNPTKKNIALFHKWLRGEEK
jgi:hypothetical protein